MPLPPRRSRQVRAMSSALTHELRLTEQRPGTCESHRSKTTKREAPPHRSRSCSDAGRPTRRYKWVKRISRRAGWDKDAPRPSVDQRVSSPRSLKHPGPASKQKLMLMSATRATYQVRFRRASNNKKTVATGTQIPQTYVGHLPLWELVGSERSVYSQTDRKGVVSDAVRCGTTGQKKKESREVPLRKKTPYRTLFD